MVLVSGFMTKDVVRCTEWDPIQAVLDEVVEKKISCVVVVGKDDKPVGLVTKSDLVAAYKLAIPLHQKVGVIMRKDLKYVHDTDTRDAAAKAFEHEGNHHAIVLNGKDEFVGVISTWDIAAEVARDSRAWPWLRTEDGRVHVGDVH